MLREGKEGSDSPFWKCQSLLHLLSHLEMEAAMHRSGFLVPVSMGEALDCVSILSAG